MLLSCENKFLDQKPVQSLVVPETISDYQQILDNVTVMNTAPGLSQVASDDLTISSIGWNALGELDRNCFIWSEDLYGNLNIISDWTVPYQQIFYANVVLDGLKTVKMTDMSKVNELRGAALFFRALALFNLTQLFADSYKAENAEIVPGIPVRTSADVNVLADRGTLKTTYSKIIEDLTEAAALLPAGISYKTRPSKPAAVALLAQVYLLQSDFRKTLEFAEECLSYSGELMDYNELDSSQVLPFPMALLSGNKEIIFYTTLLTYPFFNNPLTQIDPELYSFYREGDLRKSLFFQKMNNGVVNFRGSYTGTGSTGSSSGLFSGLAADEVYLVKAEAHVRLGNVKEALTTLNFLLSKRYRKEDFVPVTETSTLRLLQIIMIEKRKELIGRGKRWSELRRVNMEPATAQTLKREINGQNYSLLPNDNRYTFPIPQAEISLNPMEQNPR